jgi:16S rRNA G1207 methylase RsmC
MKHNTKGLDKDFLETIGGDAGEIVNSVEVRADDYFITVETDAVEGSAMFHYSVAKQLIPALQRAIEYVERRQGEKVK